MTDEDDPRLLKAFEYMLRAGVRHQSGADSAAPTVIFADADYEVGDGKTGLHEDDKYANEPAIVYVRSDAYLSALDCVDLPPTREQVMALPDAPRKIWVNTQDVEDGCSPVEDAFGSMDGKFFSPADADLYVLQSALTLADCMAVPEVRGLVEERDRLKYVLEGVAGAIDTGRNEPLVVWREQIAICLTALSKLG